MLQLTRLATRKRLAWQLTKSIRLVVWRLGGRLALSVLQISIAQRRSLVGHLIVWRLPSLRLGVVLRVVACAEGRCSVLRLPWHLRLERHDTLKVVGEIIAVLLHRMPI